MSNSDSTGCLYIVATPIGNLEDITFRAARILDEVDLIAAEDTRVSRKLLSHLNISTPLVSHYKGQENRQSRELLQRLRQGQDIALISDAGTPAIADPGARLVRACHEQGIRVSPIPGPSALTALTSVAGLVEGQFLFVGFLPAKKNLRHKLLKRYRHDPLHLIFYESPRRILKTLADIATIMGERTLCLGRELTKLHEEIFSATPREAIERLKRRPKIQGEFVVIIQAEEQGEEEDDMDEEALLALLHEQGELSMKDAVKKLSRDLDKSRSALYAKALTIWK